MYTSAEPLEKITARYTDWLENIVTLALAQFKATI